MAHEIRKTDGIALYKNAAWHGLGHVLQDEISPAEALVAANLDWEVGFPKEEISIFPDGAKVAVKTSRTLYRLPRAGHTYSDGSQERYVELGRHGLGYTPLQNKELFDVAYALGSQVKAESAGSLFDGKKIFLLLRGETLNLKGNDEVVPYLALFNGHDGSLAFSAMPTSVRIVCNNTLNMSLSTGASKMYKVAHRQNLQSQIKEMEKALARFQETGSLVQSSVDQLQSKKVKSQKDLLEFWTKAYIEYWGSDEELDEDDMEETRSVLDSWTSSMEAERAVLNYGDVDMGLAANTVTQWIQHKDPKRITGGWQERRLQSNWIGSHQDKSTNVMKLALSM